MRAELTLLAVLIAAPARAAAPSREYPGLAVEAGARAAAASAEDALPAPTDAERDAAVSLLLSRLVDRGVSPPAAAAARRAVRELLSRGDGRAARALARQNLWLFVIPAAGRLTDLPEFASLRGRRTHDGRPWEDIRGVGHVDIGGGRTGCAFAEEDLLNQDEDPAVGYPGLFVVTHELSHAVQDLGLPQAQFDRSVAAYRAALARPQKTGLGWYADSNYQEDFAQAAAAYMGVGHLDTPKQHAAPARARVFAQQPDLAALLGEALGPARDIWAAAPLAPGVVERAPDVRLPD